MGNFTQSVKNVFEFDGDKITVVAKRIKRADMMKTAPLLPADGKTPTQEQSIGIINMLSEFITDYIVSMTGLTDDQGEEIAFETVVEEAYFNELLSEVCGWWFEASQLKKASVGKSKKRQRGGSEA